MGNQTTPKNNCGATPECHAHNGQGLQAKKAGSQLHTAAAVKIVQGGARSGVLYPSYDENEIKARNRQTFFFF